MRTIETVFFLMQPLVTTTGFMVFGPALQGLTIETVGLPHKLLQSPRHQETRLIIGYLVQSAVLSQGDLLTVMGSTEPSE
jgi:hypothetical protein